MHLKRGTNMSRFLAFLNGMGVGLLIANLLFSYKYKVQWEILGIIGSVCVLLAIALDLWTRRRRAPF